MAKYNVVVLDGETFGDDADWFDFLCLGKFKLYANTAPSEVCERIKDARIVLTNKVPISKRDVRSAANLELIGVMAATYTKVDIEAAREKGVLVCSAHTISPTAISQHIFALLLDLAGNISEHVSAVKSGNWQPFPSFSHWIKPAQEVASKTLGLVGSSEAAAAVAKIARSFGMKVLVCDSNIKTDEKFEEVTFVSEDEVCARSDFISLHCNLTEQSRGMVDMKFLKRMKQSACLINCAHLGLVNEQDLAMALTTGAIGGAGLDVTLEDLLMSNSPLLTAPNCIITPEVSRTGREHKARLLQTALQTIQDFEAGQPSNVVN